MYKYLLVLVRISEHVGLSVNEPVCVCISDYVLCMCASVHWTVVHVCVWFQSNRNASAIVWMTLLSQC